MFRASLCPSSGEQGVCYCTWCAALVMLDVVGSGCGALRCRVRALWRTFTVLAPYNAAPHNRYQPQPAEPVQHTTCSNTRLVLLKMGIMMPETCWESIDNKHLTVASCWFSVSLHEICKGHSRTNHEDPNGKYRYTSIRSLTSAVDGGGWLTLHFGRLTPGKETRYQLYRRLGGPQGQSGRVQKISSPPEIDPRTIQPVASPCTYYAHPTSVSYWSFTFFKPEVYFSDIKKKSPIQGRHATSQSKSRTGCCCLRKSLLILNCMRNIYTWCLFAVRTLLSRLTNWQQPNDRYFILNKPISQTNNC